MSSNLGPDDRQGRIRREPSQSARRVRADEGEATPPPSGGSGAKTVLIVLGVVLLLSCLICGGGAAAVFFGGRLLVKKGIGKVEEAAKRMEATNDMREIAIAMHSYHDKNLRFPPAAMKTKDGKPGLSWRVAILPYIGEEQLYKQFKLDQAWNHPDNLKAAERMPRAFAADKSQPGKMTHVRVFVGGGAMFDMDRGLGIAQIRDGLTNTIMLAQAADEVLWIQPDELRFDRKQPLPSLGLPENDYFLVAMADASVRAINKSANVENIKNAITADGGEKVDLSFP